MRLRRIKFLELLISVAPLIWCLVNFSHLVEEPSTKTGKGNGVLVSKPEFVGLVAVMGLLFYVVSLAFSEKLALWFVPRYERVVRLLMVVAFTLLGIGLVNGNLK